MRDAELALGGAFHLSSVVERLWASLCGGGTGVVEGIGRAVCMVGLQGVTVLLKATTAVRAGSGNVTRHVWHLAALLMGRVTSATTWQVSALPLYLSLTLQNHQAWLSSVLDASESSTLKRA